MGEFIGNLLGGAAEGGKSGSIGYGKGNTKQQNTYLGESYGQKPLEDIGARLAAQANQEQAQKNLLFAGGGYGGSFQTAKQSAQQQAGQPIDNSKPYGGWGGYGYDNPTLSWNQGGAPPDGVVTEDGPPIQIPVQGGAGVGPGGSIVPIPTGGGGVITEGAPVPINGGVKAPAPSGGGYTEYADTPTLSDYGLGSLGSGGGGGITGGAPVPATGGVKAPVGNTSNAVSKVDAQGSPEWIAQAQQDYKAQLASQGLQFSGKYPPSIDPTVIKLKQDLVAQGMDPNSNIDGDGVQNSIAAGVPVDTILKHYQTILQQQGPTAFSQAHGALALLDPEALKNGTQTQQTLANAAGATEGPIAGTKAAPAAAAKAAPGGETSNIVQTIPDANGDYPATPTDPATPATPTNSGLPADLPPWLTKIIGDVSNIVNQDDGQGGNGNGTTGGAGGGGGTGGTVGTSDDRAGRPSQWGPQGFNPSTDPKTGKPMDPLADTTSKGYAGGDAWSTSPEWRPDEPTGGLYGAYTELAGGQQTDYENAINQDWKQRAEGPMSTLDADTFSSIKTFGATPGRGEDEAYGAYGDMLKSGYSPEEQSAITQQGMAAARAGFESNRDAILRNQAKTNNSAGYAANMAKMARGFGETMGSQARQNTIDFANEAQKRKETGASGMLNVAGLANNRSSTALSAQQAFGNAQNQKQETALGGMQNAAGYGRDLQKQGLAGLQGLYNAQDPTKTEATAAGIYSAPRETYNETGSASL